MQVIRTPARLYVFSQDLAGAFYRNILTFKQITLLQPARLSEISATLHLNASIS